MADWPARSTKAQGHVTSHVSSQTYIANPLHDLGYLGYGEQSMGADEVDVSLPAEEMQGMG